MPRSAGAVEVLAVHVLRTLEHQVLEEVREPRAAFHLVLGAHSVPEVDLDKGDRVVFAEDDMQAIVEVVLLVGDGECPSIGGIGS